MASPFETYQEYYEATGPIYTFSDRPAIIALLLVACAGIFVYFIYASFTVRGSSPKNPVVLSILLATSAVSAAEAVYQHVVGKQATQASISQPAAPRRAAPLALLGMVGLGAGLPKRRSLSSQRRRKRR